jgi:hypothetical protein
MKISALLAFALVFTGCDSGTAPPEDERSYTQSILRQADGALEASLLARAEAVYPPRDSVLAVAWDPAQVPEMGYWYLGDFDGVRIPYAVTGDAVAYYSELIDAWKASEQPPFFLQASLEYRAAVSFHEAYTFEETDPRTGEPLPSESFERVYVAEMSLEWYQYCGDLCAMWIDHERIVVFDEAGELLRVFLDGPRPVPVS